MDKKLKRGEYLHKEHPKSCATDDYWGQVSRTVGGVPVTQEQIDMIINAIRAGLQISENDALLDIGCGNGALSQYFFNECLRFHGVDFSEYLINVAKKTFERKPTHTFELADAIEYVESCDNDMRFNKALCYGAFSYFSSNNAKRLLSAVHNNYPNIKLLYIGNLPDKDRADLFFNERPHVERMLDDPDSSIGVWRTKDEFASLAESTGWVASFFTMPETFYAAHYRYDVILRRNNNIKKL